MHDQDLTQLDRQARDIFLGAVETHGAEARTAYLEAACPHDSALRARVDALLRAHAEDSLLEPTGIRNDPLTAADPIRREAPGVTIGRYKLLEMLGEGGFGAVWLAEQKEPVRRQVALKIIKLGMDTLQVVARFEAERQLLAMMDHPNIAKVLDGGTTENGRPYFVMELVRGIPITRFCDENRLSPQDRLDLFIKVCNAIQHAHQKGIIHRDIKPSNILVTLHEPGSPGVPKVIDFGIAKATQGELTDITIFTRFQQFIGTPAYMSPEQAEMSPGASRDIDTRSDIYSLGVLLYELLTGRTPFDASQLLAAGLDEMRRIIREKDPVRPSTRVSTMADVERTSVAAHRQFDPPKLIHLLRGDLDWIVMKALEKDRTRRYETANGLARDLERHLNDQPVVARPPSRLYSFQKAVRRNKTVFAAAAIIVGVLILGVCGSVWEAMRAMAQKRRADEEAAKQEAINRFLDEMLASADPYELSEQNQARGANITMQEVLDAASRQVKAGSLKDRPAIEAAICRTLGRTYLRLYQPEAAEPLLQRALELNRRIHGEQSENAIGSLADLAGLYGARSRLDEQERLLRQVLAMERKLHGSEHLHVAKALLQIAHVQSWNARGRYGSPELLNGVEATYHEGLDLLRTLVPSDSPELIDPLVSLAQFILDFTGRSVEAEPLVREALPLQLAAYGQRNPATAQMLVLLATVSYWKRDFAEAERFCEQGIAIQREVLGTNHPALGGSLNVLGDVLQEENKLPQAEAAFREALDIRRRTLHGNLDVAWSIKQLARNLTAQNRFAEAEGLLRETVAYWEHGKVGGLGSEAYWIHLAALTQMLKVQNKLDEIADLDRDVLDRVRKALDPTHVAVPAALCQLGDFLASRNQSDAAADLYREAQELIPKLSSGRNRSATGCLVNSLRSRGRLADAEKVYERLIQAESKSAEEPNFFLGHLLHEFGDLLDSQGKHEAAVEQFLKAAQIRRRKPDVDLQWTLRRLGSALIECGKPAEGGRYLHEALALYRAQYRGEDLTGTAWPTKRLADALVRQGKVPEAEQAYHDAIVSYRACNATDTEDYRETVNALVALLKSEGKLSEVQAVQDDARTQSERKSRQQNGMRVP
jgi:serine/threonine protein kinase